MTFLLDSAGPSGEGIIENQGIEEVDVIHHNDILTRGIEMFLSVETDPNSTNEENDTTGELDQGFQSAAR
jgi:hypothetical protein